MKTQRIGYIRVSTEDQNLSRQLDGIELDRIFSDKVSGKDTSRPQLMEMLSYARDGDIIVVHSMDRLARNLDDLRRLVRDLTARGVTVEFKKENLTFAPGGASPMSQLLLSVMGAFAEFERALILERQREGIAIAKKAGVYKGRRPISAEKIAELRRRVAAGEHKSAVAKSLAISRQTLYEYLEPSQSLDVRANSAPDYSIAPCLRSTT